MKIQIKSIFGKVLFELEKEENTIKETLKNAISEGADLEFANLYGAKNTKEALLPIYAKWGFAIKDKSLKIGCKTKTFEEWKEWFENTKEEYSTSRNSEDFKRLQACFYAYYEYNKFLNE